MSGFLARGELVGIRPATTEDLPFLYDVWRAPDVQRNLNFVDDSTFEKWLQDNADWKSRLDCIVVSLADGQPAGYAALGSVKAPPELIILLLPAYRGRGLGTEAVRLITRYGFTSMGMSRIGGGAFNLNKASQRLLEKVGFVRDPHEDASYDNAWGEGKVTELCYHLDKENCKG